MKTFIIFTILISIFISVLSEKFDITGKVCDSVEVAELSDFKKLEGCQVVEGSIKIFLKDEFNLGNFENMTLPLLNEIAGFLMIYKVAGLKSVAQLFPNLVSIRGGQLLKGNALIIYGNPDLENVGLSHLTAVSKGTVRIEKNSMLCFVNTVDWSLLMSNETYGKSLFKDNMQPELCPLCKAEYGNCWSQEKPQLVCNCSGSFCNENGTCCEPSCLSCRDENIKDCTVCRKSITGIFPNQKCVESCPFHTNEYLNHRCITDQECINLNINSTSETPYIVFNRTCREGCPKGYQVKYSVGDNKMSASCVACSGKDCWTKCKPVLVDSVEAAESLKGCQVIQGPLEIQFKSMPGVNTEQVLFESLSDIIEIESYLKVSRSYQILNLKFLRSLKVIQGNPLESSKYSLVIWDNANLEGLFDETQKIEIPNGELFVHFNPRLCFEKIEKLSKSTTKAIDNVESSKLSNGDISCDVIRLDTGVFDITSNTAEIRWDMLKNETILEYVIYFIPAPEKNVDRWSSRDTCGNDGWTAIDVDSFDSDVEVVSYSLKSLHSYTTYAYYVKAYTSSKYAQSEIQYFTTLAGKPEALESLSSTVKSDSEILLTWKPPKKINGELENYQIEIRKLQVMKDVLKQRNFCEHPFDISELKRDDLAAENSTQMVINNRNTSNKFEDEIQKFLHSRSKRDTELECQDNSQKAPDFNRVEIVDQTKVNQFVIENLDHFSSYVIAIRACRKKDNESDAQVLEDLCSDESQVIAKTLKNETADFVENFDIQVLPSNTSEHTVRVSWIPPKNPNGMVLHYVIKLKEVNEPNHHEELICVSLFNRNVCSQTIDKLKPGNYSIQILASTMSGDFGNFSQAKFVVLKSISHLGLITSPSFMTLLFLIAISVIGVFVYKIYKRNQGSELVNDFENFDNDHPMS